LTPRFGPSVFGVLFSWPLFSTPLFFGPANYRGSSKLEFSNSINVGDFVAPL
jgi:hypothetical protein